MTQHLEDLYFKSCTTPGNIYEHCPTLRRLSAQSKSVVEFGVEHGVSTTALLAGQPDKLTSYDASDSHEAAILKQHAGRTAFEFIVGDSLQVEIEPCDLLFIDTLHTEKQLFAELMRHSDRVQRWIVLHDVVAFGWKGENGEPGLNQALMEFWRERSDHWRITECYANNNGLLVLGRIAPRYGI